MTLVICWSYQTSDTRSFKTAAVRRLVEDKIVLQFYSPKTTASEVNGFSSVYIGRMAYGELKIVTRG